jgi:hypothetical protein
VADRLAVLDGLTAVEVQRPGLVPHGARPAAAGARLLVAEGLGLLFEEGGKGALGESGGGRGGELLQGGERDSEARPVVAEGPPGDDFAPLGGQSADLVEVLGG